MTAEEKEILIKDLCSRLPYGVKVQIDLQSNIYPPMICKVCNIDFAETGGSFIGVEVLPDSYSEYREFLCKPYLFPMSSMTEEQEKYIFRNGTFFFDRHNTLCRFPKHNDDYNYVTFEDYLEIIEKLNKHHIDYRRLISMGLAIDATNLNIY